VRYVSAAERIVNVLHRRESGQRRLAPTGVGDAQMRGWRPVTCALSCLAPLGFRLGP